jgi:ubiquinone/menaquinone biosynthesis C-methylase UbiE
MQTIAGTQRRCMTDITSLSMTTQQKLVTEHFKRAAPFWNDVYSHSDVFSIIHQRRRDAILAIVDELGLEEDAEVLDVGCGAGSISLALASRGFRVKSVDQVPEMIDLTKRTASESGLSSKITATLGDIQNLAFPDSSFTFALAIGVLPWLNEYGAALNEVARVLKPNGYLIANIDNCWALHRILDPQTNFILSPIKRATGRFLERIHLYKRTAVAPSTMMSSEAFTSMLRRSGLEPVKGVMLGFGPLSFFDRHVLSGPLAVRLDNKLQRLCDGGLPILRSMGAQYLVLARKQ